MAYSLFARLPPELRNAVYEVVLIQPKPIALLIRNINGVRGAQQRDKTGTSSIGLLFTCRLIHTESLPVFYGSNTFELLANQETAPQALRNFVDNTTVLSNLRLLKQLQVNIGTLFTNQRSDCTEVELVSVLSAAQRLTILLPHCNVRVDFTFRCEGPIPPLRLGFNATSQDRLKKSTLLCLSLVAGAIEGVREMMHAGFRSYELVQAEERLGTLKNFLSAVSKDLAGKTASE